MRPREKRRRRRRRPIFPHAKQTSDLLERGANYFDLWLVLPLYRINGRPTQNAAGAPLKSQDHDELKIPLPHTSRSSTSVGKLQLDSAVYHHLQFCTARWPHVHKGFGANKLRLYVRSSFLIRSYSHFLRLTGCRSLFG